MNRLHTDELRRIILRNLRDEWRTPTAFHVALRQRGFNLGLNGWERVALVLERLANDGTAEIKIRGRVRYFRRVA